jgi:hypothetical protein
MPESSPDQTALSATLHAQDSVISRSQAVAGGMTRSALAHRIRSGGPWQRLLPGVYLAQTGAPDVVQKDMAALLHAGSGSVLNGPAALRFLGISSVEPSRFDVLVPMSRRPHARHAFRDDPPRYPHAGSGDPRRQAILCTAAPGPLL